MSRTARIFSAVALTSAATAAIAGCSVNVSTSDDSSSSPTASATTATPSTSPNVDVGSGAPIKLYELSDTQKAVLADMHRYIPQMERSDLAKGSYANVPGSEYAVKQLITANFAAETKLDGWSVTPSTVTVDGKTIPVNVPTKGGVEVSLGFANNAWLASLTGGSGGAPVCVTLGDIPGSFSKAVTGECSEAERIAGIKTILAYDSTQS